MSEISNLAYVHPEAKLGRDVRIEPFAYIDRDVEIGDRCVIRPHASVLAGTKMGNDCKIYDGSVICAEPQDFRWSGEDSGVVLGDKVVVREHVIINRSIHKNGATVIGANSHVMAQTHIGHDSRIGQWCVLGNSVKIAGDVKIEDGVIMSSGSMAHEGAEIGKLALIKGGCRISSNVPPYVIMSHNPARYDGVNSWVLRKLGKSEELIDRIATCYRYIYLSNTSTRNALRHIGNDIEICEERDEIIRFVKAHDYTLAALAEDILQ